MGWLTPVCPTLGPGHVRPKALPHSPTCCFRRGDERCGKRKPPGCSLALEPAAAATVADEMPDLVERDEVAHLTPDGRDPDLEASLAAPVAMPDRDHDGASTSIHPSDSVGRAEVVDVAVEGQGLHPVSVVFAWEVTVTRSGGCGHRPCLVGSSA
jgi:hypothetical protein